MRKVFIWGGCTSRDAVDQYPDYGLELHSYIARQSLISAYRPADPAHFDTSQVTGTFQRRMLNGDITGTMPKHLRQHAEDIDLIVWDLMIERVGVRKVTSGGMVTRNGNKAQGASKAAMGGSYEFGTDPHYRQWTWALERFTETLDTLRLRDRTIVNATPWALKDKHGATANYNAGMSPEYFNTHVARYWDAIEAKGIAVARIPEEAAIADPDHKWGPAYFHYVPTTYQAQLETMKQLMPES